MSDQTLAVFAGLGGMFGWGMSDFLAKRAIDRIGDLRTLFWSQAAGLMPLIAIFAFSREIPTLHGFDLPFLALLGIVEAAWYLAVYAGFGKGQVSLLSPIFASYAAWVALLSALVFGERISVGKWLAIGVVFAGVILISTDPRDLRRTLRAGNTDLPPGLPEIAVALVAFSFWLLALDRFIGDRDWVFFMLAIRIAETITLVAYARATRRPLGLAQHGPLMPYVSLIGCCDVIAFSAVAYGFSATTQTSIVAMLSSTYSLLTVVLARIFLQERLRGPQKLAAGIILTGIVLVSVN
jgi:drug/metabolite transporter (DMT)-like permease